MNRLIVIIVLFLSLSASAQEKTPVLLGKITKEDLKKKPYNEWMDREYTAYEPGKEALAELKKANKQ